jgi:hypothetical protein
MAITSVLHAEVRGSTPLSSTCGIREGWKQQKPKENIMTNTILKQDPQVVSELERRFQVVMDNLDSINPVTSGASGSRISFMMILAPIGYPVEPESFMDEEYLKPCMTNEEFHSNLYDSVFERLFQQLPKC